MDSEASQRLHVNIVYDGTPHSGKTTTLRSLGRLFGREVETPEERDGRTIYFDWLDHVGGRFEGQPIHCRIVAVPGQTVFARRRKQILAGADSVVFVADTSHAGLEPSRTRFIALQENLASLGRSIPIVTQLNKRDAVDAVDLERAHASFEGASARMLETVATTGTGVREAMVLAVGEAIRTLVPEASRRKLLGLREHDLGSPHGLFERLIVGPPRKEEL